MTRIRKEPTLEQISRVELRSPHSPELKVQHFATKQFLRKSQLVFLLFAGSVVNHGSGTDFGTTDARFIVNGTATTVSVATGLGTITGAGPVPITYTTIETLTVNAGPSTTLAVSGSANYTFTPVAAATALGALHL